MNIRSLDLNGIAVEKLMAMVPAIFASAPAAHVSSEYNFVRTADVLEMMARENWAPIHAVTQKPRVSRFETVEDFKAAKETTKHQVMLRNLRMEIQAQELGGLIPTITLVNSHDWSSRLVMRFGMFRLVCENGMIVGGALFGEYAIRHDRVPEDVAKIIERFTSASTRLLETAQNWARIELDDHQIEQFNREAIKIRFGDKEVDPRRIVARRYNDEGNDLWKVYNRAQEALIRGGFIAGKRKARQLSNIAENNRINVELFDLARKFSPNQD